MAIKSQDTQYILYNAFKVKDINTKNTEINRVLGPDRLLGFLPYL